MKRSPLLADVLAGIRPLVDGDEYLAAYRTRFTENERLEIDRYLRSGRKLPRKWGKRLGEINKFRQLPDGSLVWDRQAVE